MSQLMLVLAFCQLESVVGSVAFPTATLSVRVVAVSSTLIVEMQTPLCTDAEQVVGFVKLPVVAPAGAVKSSEENPITKAESMKAGSTCLKRLRSTTNHPFWQSGTDDTD